MQELFIRNLSLYEVQSIAVEWAVREGWNPGLYDAAAFYAADNRGFFGGFIEDIPVACISTVNYQNDFSFVGCYIVKPEYRKCGYGYKLWSVALQHAGTRCTGLDGVLAQKGNYTKAGFVYAHRNARYEWRDPSGCKTPNTQPLSSWNTATINDYDIKVCGYKREKFLQAWLRLPQSVTLGYRDTDGQLRGYGAIRPCIDGWKIGPLFADKVEIASVLLSALAGSCNGNKLYLDVPLPNAAALALAEKLDMKLMFETARMYKNGQLNIDIQKCFGITSFELG